MTKLLINEHPLMVLPSLAKAIGLNEAIVLQQIHYWLDPTLNKNYKEGAFWVYNTYQKWVVQFPFWSKDTVKRTIQSLEKQEILTAKNLNKDRFDKTKWYTINYHQLSKIENKILDDNPPFDRCNKPSFDECNLHPSINKETETTTETTNTLSLKTTKPKNKGIKKTSLSEGKEREMLDIWSELVEEGRIVKQITQTRKIKLNKFFKEYFQEDLEQWKKLCENIRSSEFLMGNVTNFKASLDWVLKEENLIKILEGDYGISKKMVNSEESSEKLVSKEIDTLDETKEAKLVRKKIVNKIGEGAYDSWFKKTKIEITEKQINLKVPSKFCGLHITEKYLHILVELVEDIMGEARKINVYS